jgi:hypothetical protein
MANYRLIVIKYPDGRKVRGVVEEQDYYPELAALQRLYGIRYRIGGRASKEMAHCFGVIQPRALTNRRQARASRPLSPDFGRGSGGPI